MLWRRHEKRKGKNNEWDVRFMKGTWREGETAERDGCEVRRRTNVRLK